jgi:hypothetical protein
MIALLSGSVGVTPVTWMVMVCGPSDSTPATVTSPVEELIANCPLALLDKDHVGVPVEVPEIVAKPHEVPIAALSRMVVLAKEIE